MLLAYCYICIVVSWSVNLRGAKWTWEVMRIGHLALVWLQHFSCYVWYKLVESGEGEFPFVHSLHGAVKSCTHLVHRSHWLKININHMVGIRKYMKDYERVWKYHHEFIMYTCTSTYNIIQLPGNSWCTINSYIISHTTDYHLSESIPVQWLRLWKLQTQSTTPLGSWRWRTSRWRWAHRPQYVDWYRNIWGINWYQLQSTTIYIYILYSYMMIHDTSVYSFAFLECHDVSWVMTVPNTSLTSFSCISPRICASGRARPRESFDWKSLQNSAANRDAASPAGGTNRLPSPGPGSDCSGWCLSF